MPAPTTPSPGGRVHVRFVQDPWPGPAYVEAMNARFDSIGLIVSDMAASLAFYRRLGLDIPAGADSEPHVEHTLPGGTGSCGTPRR